jgi:hypothetical protein
VTRRIYDKALFAIAAAWNLGAAAVLVFQPEFLLTRLGIAEPAARVLARSLASSAAAWGLGYALVAVNARRFRDFAWLGAISKTLFAVVYTAAFFTGRISLSAFLPALVDLLFALLFAEFLWRTAKRTEETRDGH